MTNGMTMRLPVTLVRPPRMPGAAATLNRVRTGTMTPVKTIPVEIGKFFEMTVHSNDMVRLCLR